MLVGSVHIGVHTISIGMVWYGNGMLVVSVHIGVHTISIGMVWYVGW